MRAAITALLLADADLSALVAGRVHWGRLPAAVDTLPYINLTVISAPRVYSMDGGSLLRQALLQADCWGASAAQAGQVADTITALISGYRGTVAGVFLRGLFIEGERELTGRGLGDLENLFGRSIDFRARWNAAP